MSGLFRCAGDILFDDHQPLPGQVSNVQLKKFAETSNFLQLKHPLTPGHPYFFGQIRALAHNSKITIGIAGPDIDDDAHPGNWNNTVGYHSDTGQCFSSHTDAANTKGEEFSVGDMFGVMVSYFGEEMSTVMFLKNGLPVATRYLFESDHRKFLPTICLENGPIDLGIMWPEAVIAVPKFEGTNMGTWIKDRSIKYDLKKDIFFYCGGKAEVTLQSSIPLTRDFLYYEVMVQEAVDGESPGVGIATCSPLMPVPTCHLLRDYVRWRSSGEILESSIGHTIGFGVHYCPDESTKPDFDDRKQQLVLCYVISDMLIVFYTMMIQPPGGFYPLVILSRNASVVQLNVESNRKTDLQTYRQALDSLYRETLYDAMTVINEDILRKELTPSNFRKSSSILVDIQDTACIITLPDDKKRIHAIQLQKPLDPESSFFCAEILSLNDDSVVSIGIGDSKFDLTKHPGKLTNSTGYISRDGKMYYNQESNVGHSYTDGECFREGDTVGVGVRFFSENGCSVVLFLRNGHPVGTRYLTIKRPEEFFPTISLCGNGYEVKLKVFWQNRIAKAPALSIGNVRHWCLPADAFVDQDNNTVYVENPLKQDVIQCPTPLSDELNHFEICLTEKFGDGMKPPPMIALVSACKTGPLKRHNLSNFRTDFFRFWPVNLEELQTSVSVGDLIGWGMLIPASQAEVDDRMVVCYLTINRNVALTRVLFEPPGGLYPAVVLPFSVDKVQLEFGALHTANDPISEDLVNELLKEAQDIYQREQEFLATGKDLDEFEIDSAILLKPLPKYAGEGQSMNGSINKKLDSVVLTTMRLNNVQKAVQNHRKKHADGTQSKACVIL